MSQNDFDISPGSYVKVYNERTPMTKRRSEIEPGIHKVIERKGPLFVIEDENKNKYIKSRYQLDI
jgi:hypothetical protein